jgi:hypothetical protein
MMCVVMVQSVSDEWLPCLDRSHGVCRDTFTLAPRTLFIAGCTTKPPAISDDFVLVVL